MLVISYHVHIVLILNTATPPLYLGMILFTILKCRHCQCCLVVYVA
jgi:hypothetical protein